MDFEDTHWISLNPVTSYCQNGNEALGSIKAAGMSSLGPLAFEFSE
jgi:hypothetical protein